MSDIDVTFSTNADEASRQIDGFAKSMTNAGAKADMMLGGTTAKTSKWAETTGKLSTAFSHLFGQMGRHIEQGKHMGGAIGTAVVAFVAFQKVLEAVAVALEKAHEKTVKFAESQRDLNRAAIDANKALGERGLNAANEQGQNIKRLLGTGDLDLANSFINKGADGKDAQNATVAARAKFGDKAKEALQIAFRANNAGGGTLTEGIDNLSKGQLADPTKAASRLVNMAVGAVGSNKIDITERESRLKDNRAVSAINFAHTSAGGTYLHDQTLIETSQGAAGGARAAAEDPYHAQELEKFNEHVAKLEYLEEINRNTSTMAQALMILVHPGTQSDAAKAREELIYGAPEVYRPRGPDAEP